MLGAMETSATADPVLYCFRNREVRPTDLTFIKDMIEQHGVQGERTRFAPALGHEVDQRLERDAVNSPM